MGLREDMFHPVQITPKDDTKLIATMAEELCGSIDTCPHHQELAKRYVNMVKQHYNIKE